MESRLCQILLTILFSTIQMTLAHAECTDSEYVEWVSNLIEKEKREKGGLSLNIPTSLAVAQAAYETGYGTSSAAENKNNHFGLRGKNGSLTFQSAEESVQTYLETLTNKPYYKTFQKLLKKGEQNLNILLMSLAGVYSKNSDVYKSRILAIIHQCSEHINVASR